MKLSFLPLERSLVFSSLNDEDFTIPYITDTIPNSPDFYQPPSQPNRNVWIIDINGEKTIKGQCVFDELNPHQTTQENPISMSVYAEGRATREQILRRFTPYLIKSDL